MRRLICLLLAALLGTGLCACTTGESEPVIFYYPWADLDAVMEQDPDCTAIGSEEREISGQRDNPEYLLSLYFRGPLDPELDFPFPAGTSLEDVLREGDTLTVTLSDAFAQMENIDLILACSCLAQTCFGLTDAQEILIRTPETADKSGVSIAVSRDNYLLTDIIPETIPTE